MITVVGSANMDFTVHTSRWVEPGETLLADNWSMNAGGKGANQAVAAAKLGAPTRFVGAVGQDAFGERLLEALKEAGVQVSVNRVTEPSGVALIEVGSAGENRIIVAPGANQALDSVPTWTNNDLVLLTQLEVPVSTVKAALASALEAGVPWRILNAAPAQPLADLVSLANVVVLNESELAVATGVSGVEAALEILVDQGAHLVILTQGAKGGRVVGASTFDFPAFPVQVVETVGAGDAFCGALAVGLSESQPLDEAVRFASAAAALACTKPGAQAAMPTRFDVERLLAQPSD